LTVIHQDAGVKPVKLPRNYGHGRTLLI